MDTSSYMIEPYYIYTYESRKENGELPVVSIGKKCSIAVNCTFILSQHLLDRFTTSPSYDKSLFAHGQGNLSSFSKGDIIVKNDVCIGTNVMILDGVTIGNGAVIGAGSVVVKDVPAYAIVAGNPAKIIRYRFSKKIIAKLEELNFWSLPIEEINKFDIWTDDIPDIIKKIEEYIVATTSNGLTKNNE